MEAPTLSKEAPTLPRALYQDADDALRDAGHPNPEFWHTQLHNHALDPKLDFDVQRFLVNRAFELAIGGFDPKARFSEKVAADYARDQMDARYCLLPQGTAKVWLNSFKEKVVPHVMKYQLGCPQSTAAVA